MDIFRHATKFEEFSAGTTFVREGTEGDKMYAVQEGDVEISVDGKVYERVGPGGFFGEMVLIDGGPRAASATAVTAVRVVPIDEKEFLRLIPLTPGFALRVMRGMAQRLRTTLGHLTDRGPA